VTVRPVAAGIAAVLAGAAIAGCSSAPPPLPLSRQSSTHATAAMHWWSGSDYCGILRQTLRAGHSIMAGVTAEDPDLLAVTRSFVSDLTAAAPGPVRAQWLVLGPALTALVRSGGKLSAVSGVDARRVSAAATAIATDARTRCRVEVNA
jgi:hypothetical protein